MDVTLDLVDGTQRCDVGHGNQTVLFSRSLSAMAPSTQHRNTG